MTNVDKRRRRLVTTGGALGIGALAGCVSSPDGSGGDGETSTSEGGTSEGDGTQTSESGGSGDTTNVGMVYATGGLGDNSFNDMAHAGIKQAKQELNVKFENAEPGSASEVENLQRRFAQSQSPNYDLVCCIGYVQTNSLVNNAQRFSDQKFMLVDSVAEKQNGDLLKNVANYTFKEHQGSFQVGHLAGLMTQKEFSAGKGKTKPGKKVVGFVGGKDVPLIQKFEAGYKAGVAYVSEDIEVRTAYVGAYNDPVAGKDAAGSMYDKGADIVYHAAGGSGLGVFKAARQRGRFGIGVDGDQSKSTDFADVILASMVKHVDEAVNQSAKNVANGSFKGGNVNSLGLKAGGVETVYGQQLGSNISDDVKSKIEESRKAIVDGEVDVPKKPNN